MHEGEADGRALFFVGPANAAGQLPLVRQLDVGADKERQGLCLDGAVGQPVKGCASHRVWAKGRSKHPQQRGVKGVLRRLVPNIPVFPKGAELEVDRTIEVADQPQFHGELLEGVLEGRRQASSAAVGVLTRRVEGVVVLVLQIHVAGQDRQVQALVQLKVQLHARKQDVRIVVGPEDVAAFARGARRDGVDQRVGIRPGEPAIVDIAIVRWQEQINTWRAPEGAAQEHRGVWQAVAPAKDVDGVVQNL